MYDIVGDIHGHADELRLLLQQLDYVERDGVHSHSDRRMVFVGDFIDRGPKIPEVLRIVRAMIESGSAQAVMGNHEFNAISYHTPIAPSGFARRHSEKNNLQHCETLRQMGDDLGDYIDWFRTLPLWLDLGDIRVVHATWDPQQNRILEQSLQAHGGVTPAWIMAANQKDDPVYAAVEDVLKGREVDLPDGQLVADKDGHGRNTMRVKWFAPSNGHTYASYALSPDSGYPDTALAEQIHESTRPYSPDEPPVFFGHYWLRVEDRPERLATNVACVDYSVAKGGHLCAYRWDGERELSNDNFVAVTRH